MPAYSHRTQTGWILPLKIPSLPSVTGRNHRGLISAVHPSPPGNLSSQQVTTRQLQLHFTFAGCCGCLLECSNSKFILQRAQHMVM